MPAKQVVQLNAYIFKQVIVDDDLFALLRPHRLFIKEQLEQILRPKLQIQLALYPNPVIGIHVRRGDFKIANPVTP